jgi:iron complex transport system substrate-binding protein
MQTQHIVSLVPSGTEIVYALGFGQQLVGRSHECDYPASVRQLPVCTEPKFNVEGTSAEISGRVSATLQEALSVYNIHADVLQRLKPDVIITQSQCEVCSVSPAEVERVACQLYDISAQVIGLEPDTLADVFRGIEQIAEALSEPERGRQLVESLHTRMMAIYEHAHTTTSKPTVALLEWLDPQMPGGHWMPELVEMAGGIDLFGKPGQRSSWMQWDDLLSQDPEVIVLVPCSFDIARSRHELPVLTGRPGWADLSAVRHHRVYLADSNQYFSRPGPRLVESLEILAEILHPDVFNFGHSGIDWQPL